MLTRKQHDLLHFIHKRLQRHAVPLQHNCPQLFRCRAIVQNKCSTLCIVSDDKVSTATPRTPRPQSWTGPAAGQSFTAAVNF